MQSEHMETRIESDVVVTPARDTRRVAWSLLVIVLLSGYAAGFFTLEDGGWKLENGLHFPLSPFHFPPQAMRGLAAYLLTEYGDEYSDEEIVAELNKWRATYFPKQTLGETLLRMKQAGEPGIDEIEQEFPEFMPDMVGEC